MPNEQPNIKRNVRGGPSNGPNNPSGGKRIAPRERTTITWGEIDNGLLRNAVCAVADNGAAILLGKTSDGGALSIKVFDGNDKVEEWPHSVADCESTLRWLIEMFAVS